KRMAQVTIQPPLLDIEPVPRTQNDGNLSATAMLLSPTPTLESSSSSTSSATDSDSSPSDSSDDEEIDFSVDDDATSFATITTATTITAKSGSRGSNSTTRRRSDAASSPMLLDTPNLAKLSISTPAKKAPMKSFLSTPIPDEEEALEFEDETIDPANLSANELRARKAVRYAIITNPTFDKFSVISIVGFGSNGAVVSARPRGRDAPEDAILAIKIIYKSVSASPTAKPPTANDPWPHEVLLHRRLSAHHAHTNLLHSHAHFQDLKHFYVVLDLVDVDWLHRFGDSSNGGVVGEMRFRNARTGRRHSITVSPGGKADLWAWSVEVTTPADTSKSTASKALAPPVESCRALFADIARALRHLHRLGVHHGDLKPENVLVSAGSKSNPLPSGRLCDLGHARHAPALDAPEHLVTSYGTRELSAPELLVNLSEGGRGRKRVDAFKLDVFALGTLLFTMLHGPARLPSASTGAVRTVAGIPLDVVERDCGVDPRGLVYLLSGYDIDCKSWDLPGLVDEDLSPRLRGEKEIVSLLRGMLKVDPKRRMTIEDVCRHPWIAALVESGESV
ncbi:kinase-like domain-containing protein, partial [Zopfochytrium polystomum]